MKTQNVSLFLLLMLFIIHSVTDFNSAVQSRAPEGHNYAAFLLSLTAPKAA